MAMTPHEEKIMEQFEAHSPEDRLRLVLISRDLLLDITRGRADDQERQERIQERVRELDQLFVELFPPA